jgi:hypothetical protein
MMIDLEAKCYSPGIFGTEVNTLAFERSRAWSRGYDIVKFSVLVTGSVITPRAMRR